MTPEIKRIFEPVAAAICRQDLSIGDLLNIIGGFAGTSPRIAQAMAFHARDFMGELDDARDDTRTYSNIIAETYRRTFFDEEQATKYGTEALYEQGPETLKSFADHLLSCFAMDVAMDKAQATSRMFIAGSTKSH